MTGAGVIPHGTSGGYTNHRCRCGECREAATAAHRRWRERAVIPDHQEGTINLYTNYGCRCPGCREAQKLWARRYHRRLRERTRRPGPATSTKEIERVKEDG